MSEWFGKIAAFAFLELDHDLPCRSLRSELMAKYFWKVFLLEEMGWFISVLSDKKTSCKAARAHLLLLATLESFLVVLLGELPNTTGL